MLYKFKSKSACDMILLGTGGDRLLRAIGKQRGEGGILSPRELPDAIEAIALAISQDEAQEASEGRPKSSVLGERVEGVTLRQLAWPFVEMMKVARDEGEAIVWHQP